jgi:hypothetical protein
MPNMKLGGGGLHSQHSAFGVGAGEIMAAVQVAIIAGLAYTALRDAVLTHPTLVEGLIPLFSSVAKSHGVAEATIRSPA